MLELAVEPQDWVAGRTLSELELREEGVVILGISRRSGAWVGAPGGATRIEAGDTLLVYGLDDAVCELDGRPRGAAGDAAHERAVAVRHRSAA